MNYLFDWDWYILAMNAGVTFIPNDRYLSIYRIHPSHKSSTGGVARTKEIASIYKKYHCSEYETLFLNLCKRKRSISFIYKWLNRFRMKKLDIFILKLIYFNIFVNSGISSNNIRAMIKMI